MNRQTLAVVAVAALAGLAGWGVGLWHSDDGRLANLVSRVSPGGAEAFPPFAVKRLDGGTLALPTGLAGRPTLVNVWASWCGPCIEEMPLLDAYAARQGANGTQVVGIALDEPGAVRAFLARVPVRYSIAWDTPGLQDAGTRLGNSRGLLPYTVLLDARGRIVKRRFGPFAPGELDSWARIQTAD